MLDGKSGILGMLGPVQQFLGDEAPLSVIGKVLAEKRMPERLGFIRNTPKPILVGFIDHMLLDPLSDPQMDMAMQLAKQAILHLGGKLEGEGTPGELIANGLQSLPADVWVPSNPAKSRHKRKCWNCGVTLME